MKEQNSKIKEDIKTSQGQSDIVGNSKIDLKEIAKKEEQYKALVNFFKNDMEIKNDLMSLAPKPVDEYSEESRMDYLDRLFSELKDMEFKFKSIVRNFNMGTQLENSFSNYFDKAKKELSELGYGRTHESLQKIYQKIFTDMKPELIEKAKQTFCGYTAYDGVKDVSSMMSDVSSINELLHIVHSSIINDEKILQSMPILGTKKNSFGYDINLYGKENEISKVIFENFPYDLDVGFTDIVSMEDRTLMMIRDRGHALTIDINSSDKDNIDVRYFIPKICNLDMVKALPGINTSSITQNGASGFWVLNGENISESIYNFIDKVPMDKDIPEIKMFRESDVEIFDEPNMFATYGETNEALETENENPENISLFGVDDAKSLATSRKFSKIKEIFSKFKEFIKSKSKGEDNGKSDKSR